MKNLLLSFFVSLTIVGCGKQLTPAQEGSEVRVVPQTTIPDSLLEPPCKARVVGKSLLDITKNSKHNSYCAYLHQKQLEEIKASIDGGDELYERREQ